MKKLFKRLGQAFLVLIVLVSLYMASDWPFWSTILRLTANITTAATDESLYRPKDAVPGRAGGELPAGGTATISDMALAEARALADDWGSSALLIWQGGALKLEHYGDGFGPETRTEPASMNKSVTGLMVGAAIADGYIKSVDDPVGDYFTEWAGTPMGAVPIRFLLQMRSGLRGHPMFGPPSSPLMRIFFGDDIVPEVLKYDLESEPGTDFQYNGINSQVLALIVERASGKRYADYLSERLWQRIGADDAAFWLDHEGGLPRGFCCLFTNARSWLKVGLLHLNEGRVGETQVLPVRWMQDMATPSPVYPNYGYQTWLGTTYEANRHYNRGTSLTIPQDEPFLAPDLIYFDGAGGQRVYISKALDLVIVRLGKSKLDWEESRLPNVIIGGMLDRDPAVDTQRTD